MSGGLFPSANAALSFWGVAKGRGWPTPALARGPQGACWSHLTRPHQSTASAIWGAGGRPFALHRGQWRALTSAGMLVEEDHGLLPDAHSWPACELIDVVAAIVLPPGKYAPCGRLSVIAPPPLGSWIIRKAWSARLNVEVTPVRRRALAGGNEEHALLIGLSAGADADGRTIPAWLVQSIADLPYTVVTQSPASDSHAILVDVSCHCPALLGMLAAAVPPSHTWVLGSADAGHWLLSEPAETIDAALLLATSRTPAWDLPPQGAAHLPSAPEVRLARRHTAADVDAVLIDEEEVPLLRRLLQMRPLDESAFVVPGAGVYLLVSPGDLPGQVPLGTPLARAGPGNLYIELGLDFDPPLPLAAREARFQLSPQTAVALLQDRAYRFNTTNILPAWALWVGPAPAVDPGMSAEARELLSVISPEACRTEVIDDCPLLAQDAALGRELHLQEALQAEHADNLIEAARRYELAGAYGYAGRLYERAANQRAVVLRRASEPDEDRPRHSPLAKIAAAVFATLVVVGMLWIRGSYLRDRAQRERFEAALLQAEQQGVASAAQQLEADLAADPHHLAAARSFFDGKAVQLNRLTQTLEAAAQAPNTGEATRKEQWTRAANAWRQAALAVELSARLEQPLRLTTLKDAAFCRQQEALCHGESGVNHQAAAAFRGAAELFQQAAAAFRSRGDEKQAAECDKDRSFNLKEASRRTP